MIILSCVYCRLQHVMFLEQMIFIRKLFLCYPSSYLSFNFLYKLFVYIFLRQYIISHLIKLLTRIPVAEKDIAPIAHPLSGRRNSSGISRQAECMSSGTVPWRQGIHWFSSIGCRICLTDIQISRKTRPRQLRAIFILVAAREVERLKRKFLLEIQRGDLLRCIEVVRCLLSYPRRTNARMTF